MQESEYLTGRSDLVEKFQHFPFLRYIESDHLLKMLQLSKLRRYEKREVITPEDTYDSFLYVLVEGEVKIVKEKNEIARLCNNGDTFGELAILDGGARSATVIATEKTVCLAIDASFLDRLPKQEQAAFYSVFYRLLSEILSHRLRDTDEELVRCKNELTELKKERFH